VLLKQFLLDEYRFLTLRAPSAAVREHSGAYLAFGLLLTWLAGVGRYWDSPDALPWQYAGLSSLIYVFLLALVIWTIVLPLGPRNWSYRNVLLFVSLTAPPALLYAIPVEIFFSSAVALALNGAFLAVVAVWRVALLFTFLRRVAGLDGVVIVVAALLPLALIVDGLALMNLEHLVYQTMIGTRDTDGTADDSGRAVVQFTCTLAAVLTPALLACYCWLAYAGKSAREGAQ
jgi:hypothetical protein